MVLVLIVDGGYPRLKIDLNCVVNDVPTIELLPVHRFRDRGGADALYNYAYI